MQEECAAEVAEMHIFISLYMIRGDWRQIYPSRRILHNQLHQNWEKKKRAVSSSGLCVHKTFKKRRGEWTGHECPGWSAAQWEAALLTWVYKARCSEWKIRRR